MLLSLTFPARAQIRLLCEGSLRGERGMRRFVRRFDGYCRAEAKSQRRERGETESERAFWAAEKAFWVGEWAAVRTLANEVGVAAALDKVAADWAELRLPAAPSAEDLARLLLEHAGSEGIGKAGLGIFLAGAQPLSAAVRARYLRLFDFAGASLAAALRALLAACELPAVGPDRIVETFAAEYFRQNPESWLEAQLTAPRLELYKRHWDRHASSAGGVAEPELLALLADLGCATGAYTLDDALAVPEAEVAAVQQLLADRAAVLVRSVLRRALVDEDEIEVALAAGLSGLGLVSHGRLSHSVVRFIPTCQKTAVIVRIFEHV
jgi:hypothetical protein